MRRKQQLSIPKIKALEPYQHQQDVTDAWNSGQYDRFFLNWHRRAGKDVFGLEFARNRMEERTGTYWHLFPFHVQAKRAIWNGIDARDGVRFIDRAFPPHLRDGVNQTEMSIDWKGSHWQMLGSDNYDRMVGSNPCGIVFSEWALCDPMAWDYIRPILVENKGWAMFITTFRGCNHAYRMFNTVKDLENWYVSTRTVRDTFKKNGAPIVTEADIQKEINSGMSPALVEQEFYCNPLAASTGAIFSRQYARLLNEQPNPYTRDSRLVRVAWGIHHQTICAIVFSGPHIIAVHTFNEWNIVDAIQAVARRHPHLAIVHHAENADPSIYGDIDGVGYVNAIIPAALDIRHGLTAFVLNACTVTSNAKERLCDFTMSYAPYRTTHDDIDESNFAISNSLAVMRSSQPLVAQRPARPLQYASDRGVI